MLYAHAVIAKGPTRAGKAWGARERRARACARGARGNPYQVHTRTANEGATAGMPPEVRSASRVVACALEQVHNHKTVVARVPLAHVRYPDVQPA